MCIAVMRRVFSGFESLVCAALCSEVYEMQISETASGVPDVGSEQCRFPKLEECAHFHYEKVQLPPLEVSLHSPMDKSLHSHNSSDHQENEEYYTLQVTSGDECWLLQRTVENFRLFDAQLHQCIYDRKISHLPNLSEPQSLERDPEHVLDSYLREFCSIANNSLNCGPVLNWLQMDNRGHRLLVPSEESRSINTPAVAAAYSVRRYVSQARDELDLEVGDMISVIDMASPGESVWWRGKRGFKVGFFPQHCVHIIGEKVPRNMPLPPPVVGSLVVSPMKPVLRKHGKLIAFFRSFILNRPSRRRLKQSGILKERVFGCDLGEHLSNSGNNVPTVLRCCAEFIEKNGIVDGIYRLSGVTSNIQKLRNAFDEDRIPNLYTEEILQDIHSVASLLKMYFRELPNPLCTYQLYQSFVNAVQGCNPAVRSSDTDHERLLKMREAVQKLPPPHYRTLEYLMRHLARVAKHGNRTGMTTRNVAIVWAPNLLRSEELEGGGVAALQGVGVQAVVTEYLICYTDLIFCDRLPASVTTALNLNKSHQIHHQFPIENVISSPKRGRPKSLAISTPTKLITLEEARNKHHQLNRGDDCGGYIEVGGGPKNLPKKYHTIIELPSGRKRHSSGWRSFFSKSRYSSQNTLPKSRKASTPGVITAEKNLTDATLLEAKRKLRSVKSAESLTSGASEIPQNNEIDSLGPLQSLQKAPGHNRSVSHDSYFDLLQTSSQNNSEGSLLDLSEIQLNFDLEESEMRIFSEDESLVSSPRIVQKDPSYRRYLSRPINPTSSSPKKQPRVVVSPESISSRKRTRLEDQLSDIQYIDCGTPDNNIPQSNSCLIEPTITTAVVHQIPEIEKVEPKSKSPRSCPDLESKVKRQSLNLDERKLMVAGEGMVKSSTDIDLGAKLLTPTPQSPGYKRLNESNGSSPIDFNPAELFYQQLKASFEEKHQENVYENFSPVLISKPAKSPTYENVLTTISITYKSPTKRFSNTPLLQPQLTQSNQSCSSSTNDLSIYEDVSVNITEKAPVPIEPLAVLPTQEANQPEIEIEKDRKSEQRPKSLSALEDLKGNLSTSAVCNSRSEARTLSSNNETLLKSSETTLNSNSSVSSSEFNANMTNSTTSSSLFQQKDASELSMSEVGASSSENLTGNQFSCPITPTQNSLSPNVSQNESSEIEGRMDKRKSSETLDEENVIYQQVKYFRRSIHEINALLELGGNKNDLDGHIYENVDDKVDLIEVKDDQDVQMELKEEIEEDVLEKVDVKLLKKNFEVNSTQNLNQNSKLNPPCVRLRNLKHTVKTRSLDENDFNKEVFEKNPDDDDSSSVPRRKSLDEENLSFSTLKSEEIEGDKKIGLVKVDLTEQKLNRERIEKYKEERRKVLHEKYRSESFKEDKDVLLSRLKLKRNSEKNRFPFDEMEEIETNLEKKIDNERIESPPINLETKSCGLKSLTAKFESQILDSPRRKVNVSDGCLGDGSGGSCDNNSGGETTTSTKLDVSEEILRNRRNGNEFLGGLVRCSRRRHTFDAREREGTAPPEIGDEKAGLVGSRRSVDAKSPRKEKTSPSLCIKDMKAIFESKSQQ
nr:GTPase-activating protein CdGAPr-like isoform X1 [Onthophagus taurus]